MNETLDVLVIGAGPAGATAATLLARRGFRVIAIDKDRHPRFHIGESLLPANLPLLDRLGVRDEVEAIGMRKWGIEFVSPHHPEPAHVDFVEGWNKDLDGAFQVRRADFDHILIRNARRSGAEVIEGCRATAVSFDDTNGDGNGGGEGGGVTVDVAHDDGRKERLRARFLVDASGRDTFLANRFKCKQKNPKHNSSALYAHFDDAERLPGRKEGNISIFWFDHGWFWFIPLAGKATSVGAVCWPYYLKSRKKPLDQFFLDTIAMCPPLAARLRDATLATEVTATGNYAYSCDRTRGERYLLLGDAYAFIDPVFSSGVFLAMNSAFVGVDAVDACLRDPARAPAALAEFDRVMRHGPREFSWFIYRVTNPTMRELFMAPRNTLRMKEALISLFAGDIFEDTPIWRSLKAFKGVYYLSSLANLPRTVRAWKRRQVNIRDPEADARAG